MVIIAVVSIIIYVIATLMISTNTYEFERGKKIEFMLIGISIILLATWMIVSVSSKGIQLENQSYLNTIKTTSVLIFAPINTILALPYLGNIINKYKQKRLQEVQIKKRLIVWSVFLVIIVIIETSYIKSFELGILNSVIK